MRAVNFTTLIIIRAHLQEPSQRLADVRWVKTRKIKDGVTAQSAVRDCYEAGVRVTSRQSDRRWKAFQQYDGITNAARYSTQEYLRRKALVNGIACIVFTKCLCTSNSQDFRVTVQFQHREYMRHGDFVNETS